QFTQHVEPAAARQVEVQQEEVVGLARQRAQHLVTVGEPVDRVALVGQELLEGMPQGRVVFDYKNSHAAILARRRHGWVMPAGAQGAGAGAAPVAGGLAAAAPGAPACGAGVVMKPMRASPARRAAAITLASVS